MIKRIELVNWKTHKDTVIEFQKGVNVLVGIMGAGKSSVMDAISYALFGTFPALIHKRVSLGDTIMSRPTEETHAEVRLDFDAEGSEYRIERKISAKQGSSARIEKDGNYLQTQSERVTEAIEEILKLDYDTFSRAVYAEQNGLEYFLDLSKGERKRSIDEMLGLDHFSAAEENVTSYINSVRSMIEGEENALAQIDVKGFKNQMEALSAEREAVLKTAKELEGKALELSNRSKEAKAKLNTLRGEMEKKRLLMDERTKVSSRNATLNGEIKKIDALGIVKEDIEGRLKSAMEKAEAASSELEKLRKEESDAVRRLSALETDMRTLNKKNADRKALQESMEGVDEAKLAEESERLAKDLEALRNGIAEKRTGIAEGKKWIEELSKHLSTCPLCERELSQEMRRNLLESKESAVQALEKGLKEDISQSKELEARSKSIKDSVDRLALYKARLKDFEGLDKDIDRVSAELEKAKEGHSKADKAYTAKAAESEKLKKDVNRIGQEMEKVKARDDYAKEIKANEISLKGIDDDLSGMTVDDKAIYSAQDALTKISAEQSEANSKAESSMTYAKSLDSQIAEKRKQIEDFSNVESRIRGRRALVANLNKFKVALIDTEAMLRSKLIGSVNSLMQSVWSELYPYGDYTAIRLTAKKDDYLLESRVVVNGAERWLSIDAVASGGERSLACLAMRIAMSMVIVPNLRWIILDEPTHNVDSNGIDRLISMLGSNLPKVVDQVFIITHDESMKQISNARVYMLDRDKEAHGNTVASIL